MTDDDLWYAPIRHQDHADQRIAERVGRYDVLGEIRLALLCGRFTPERPIWISDRPARPEKYPVVYAWDETLARCWVLRRANRVLFLVTVLLERNAWREIVETGRGVRSGSARA